MYGLNLAHAQELMFGPQIAFTFGPLAYLGVPDPTIAKPATVFLFDLLVYIPLIYSLVLICKRLEAPLISAAIIFVIVVTLQFRWNMAENLQVTFWCLILLLAIRFSLLETAAFLLAGFLAGMSLLVKTNDGVTDLLTFYIVWIIAVSRSKSDYFRALVFGTLPPLTFFALFVGSQNSANGLVLYLRNSLSAIDGYSAGMSLVGPVWEVWLGLFSIVLIFAVALFWTKTGFPLPNIVLALPMTLAAFKHAMVRQDAHTVELGADLAATYLVFTLGAQTRFRRVAFTSFAVLNVICGLMMARVELPEAFTRTIRNLELRNLAGETSKYWHLHRSWALAKHATQLELASKRVRPELAREIGHGSVHDMAWNVDLIRANNWLWNPCPVFQSYAAYTPLLDNLDAQHLQKYGSDFVTVTWEEIDNRHPFLDTAATWRALLDRYDLVRGDFDLFLLRRRHGHRLSPVEPVSPSFDVHWNQVLRLPNVSDDRVLIMNAYVKQSAWGYIRRVLFRTDPTYLEVIYSSGTRTSFRTMWANLSDGAIVSDLPRSLIGLLPMLGYKPPGERDRVKSVRFLAADASEFKDPITVSWSSVRMLDMKEGPAPLPYPEVRALVPLWTPWKPIEAISGLTVASARDQIVLRPTNLDPQILFDTGQDLRRFRTIVVRAKFSVADQINLFFGMQVNGRVFSGFSSPPNEWLDIYINTGSNRYWAKEADRVLRFDPSTNLSLNSHSEIAGVWGSEQSFLSGSSEMKVYPIAASGIKVP